LQASAIGLADGGEVRPDLLAAALRGLGAIADVSFVQCSSLPLIFTRSLLPDRSSLERDEAANRPVNAVAADE